MMDFFFFFFVKAWQDMKKGWTKLLNTGRQEAWFPMLEAWKAEPMPQESRVLERKAVVAICLQSSDAKRLRKSKQCSTSPLPSTHPLS